MPLQPLPLDEPANDAGDERAPSLGATFTILLCLLMFFAIGAWIGTGIGLADACTVGGAWS